MLKAGLISCRNKNQNIKSKLPAKKHSGSEPNLSSYFICLEKNFALLYIVHCLRPKDTGILKCHLSLKKNWINDISKSKMFNEALLESKKFRVIKCPKII